MVTAAIRPGTRRNACGLGAMDFVRKPYVTDVVKRRVKNIVELYHYQNGLEECSSKKGKRFPM